MPHRRPGTAAGSIAACAALQLLLAAVGVEGRSLDVDVTSALQLPVDHCRKHRVDELPDGCTKVDSGGRRKVLMFGAMGRHNFGDLLMPWMVETLLQKFWGFRPDDFLHADLVASDMTQYGGHHVLSVGSVLKQSFSGKLDVIHVGGETLQCSPACALSMLPGELPCNRADVLNMRLAYVLPKELLANPGMFIGNALGGSANPSSLVRSLDVCTLRNAVSEELRGQCESVPDSVVMINTLFSKELQSRPATGIPAFRKFFALQFNHLTVLSDKFAKDLALVAREHHADGIILFRAGAAPAHDNITDLRAMTKRFESVDSSIDVAVFEGLNIWDISALISKSSLLISTSLHCRIIAFSCNVPRVTLPSGGQIQYKIAEFVRLWDSGIKHAQSPADDIGLSAREALLPESARIFSENTRRGVARYTEAFHGWASKLVEQRLKP